MSDYTKEGKQTISLLKFSKDLIRTVNLQLSHGLSTKKELYDPCHLQKEKLL
jgi:hypothetical protein